MKWRVLSRLAAIMAVLVCCAADSSKNSSLMPEGFQDVRLQMPPAELVQVRPKAEQYEGVVYKDVIEGWPPPGDPQVFFESLSGRFDAALYYFYAQRLCTVAFTGRTSNSEGFEVQVARHLRGAIKKWGEDFNRIVIDSSDDARRGVSPSAGLRWKKGSIEVAITYTARPEMTPESPPPSWGLTFNWNDCDKSQDSNSSTVTPADGKEYDHYFKSLNIKVEPTAF